MSGLGRLFVSSLIIAGIMSCNQADEKIATSGLPIRLTTEMDPATRATGQDHLIAAGTQFTAGRHIALYMTESNASTGAEIDVTATNISYKGGLHTLTTGADGAISFDLGEDCYWPGTNKVNFYAWYPYSADGCFAGQTSKSTPTFTVAEDQSSNESYTVSDLLYARHTAVAKQTNAYSLTFHHALSKLIVVMQSSDGKISGEQLASASVTLDGTTGAPIYLDAVVDIDGGTASYKTDGGTTTQLKLGTGSTTFCVIPSGQNLTGKVISFSLQDGGSQTYTIQSLGTLSPGKKYTVTLTLTLNSISVTETVQDWLPGGADRDKTGTPFYI